MTKKKNFGFLSPGILWSWVGTRWQDGYFYSDIGKWLNSLFGAKQKVENVMKLIIYSKNLIGPGGHSHTGRAVFIFPDLRVRPRLFLALPL